MLTSSCFSFFPLGELTSAAGKVKPGVGVGFHPQKASPGWPWLFRFQHGDDLGIQHNFSDTSMGKDLRHFLDGSKFQTPGLLGPEILGNLKIWHSFLGVPNFDPYPQHNVVGLPYIAVWPEIFWILPRDPEGFRSGWTNDGIEWTYKPQYCTNDTEYGNIYGIYLWDISMVGIYGISNGIWLVIQPTIWLWYRIWQYNGI